MRAKVPGTIRVAVSEGVTMSSRKNTALLMSKLPEPGRVKTRLTVEHGGRLTPEAACSLYHSMLLDVVEATMAALDGLARPSDAYDLVIATPDAENVGRLKELVDKPGPWICDYEVVFCEGEGFGKCLDDAIAQCFARGADCVLGLRGDCPTLTLDDVKRGFAQLQVFAGLPGGGMVLAPNHRMGVSIVGLTREAKFTHEGIFGNKPPQWVLPSYIAKAARLGLAVSCLPPLPDVDTMGDLIHVATLVQAQNYCAPFDGTRPPWRTAAALYRMGFRDAVLRPAVSTSGT